MNEYDDSTIFIANPPVFSPKVVGISICIYVYSLIHHYEGGVQ